MNRGFGYKISVLVLILLISGFISKNFFFNYFVNYEKEVILGGENIGFYSDNYVENSNSLELSSSTKTFSAGTLTYIDPVDNSFGALGHGDKGVNTNGVVFATNVISYTKNGASLGYKLAQGNDETIVGEYNKNTGVGIFGTYYNTTNKTYIKVGMPTDIYIGTAYIRTVLDNSTIELFEIKIYKVNMFNAKKNIYFEVVDKELLNKTGGLIRGMSGSPIIQNDKLIGAVSSVDSNDFTKGYGVFITTMLGE